MKFVGFDLEVCTWPESGNWDKETPLGISCVGLMGSDWDEPEVLYASSCSGSPEPRAMREDELHHVLALFKEYRHKGYIIVSWNGLQFDFLNMALSDPSHAYDYAMIAMDHIDMMFYILCHKGWPVGLEAVAHGIGLSGKTAGMSGDKAPDMWMGKEEPNDLGDMELIPSTLEDRNKVLEYVGQDAITTVDIVEIASRTKTLKWRSKSSGRWQFLEFMPLTTKVCLNIPVPDTSWMDNPLTRESFYDWTKSHIGNR